MALSCYVVTLLLITYSTARHYVARYSGNNTVVAKKDRNDLSYEDLQNVRTSPYTCVRTVRTLLTYSLVLLMDPAAFFFFVKVLTSTRLDCFQLLIAQMNRNYYLYIVVILLYDNFFIIRK